MRMFSGAEVGGSSATMYFIPRGCVVAWANVETRLATIDGRIDPEPIQQITFGFRLRERVASLEARLTKQ